MLRYCRIFSLLLSAALSGCAFFGTGPDETKDWSANKFYSEAKGALNSRDYEQAIKYYEGLQARYPFGAYAQQSQLDLAYAYYKFEEPDSAIAAADRFIRLYPRHPNVDYAHYIKGLANFNRGSGLLERYLPQDTSQRDPGAAKDSFTDFATLVKQFPTSKYAQDARQRMVFLRNNLALYEVHVARYYMRRGGSLAAANRASSVVARYQKTPAVPYALRILVDAYSTLGLADLSNDALRVLELNYPEHPSLTQSAYLPTEKGGSTLSRMWSFFGLDR